MDTPEDSFDIGDNGEDNGRQFLSRSFTEILSPRRDRGIDILCKTPRFDAGPPLLEWPSFRFQVKAGDSYHYIRIKLARFDSWIRHCETEPVILLLYRDPKGDNIRPDSFLVFRDWLLDHLPTFRTALASGNHITIKAADFQPIEHFQSELAHEAERVSQLRKGPFPEYYFFRYFPSMVAAWEFPVSKYRLSVKEFLKLVEQAAPADDISRHLMAAGINPKAKHPVAVCSPSQLEQTQEKFYRVLRAWQGGMDFHLNQRFTSTEVGVARAMASKYPELLHPALGILRRWRDRRGDSLTALQIIGAMAQFDTSAEAEAVSLLRDLREDVRRIGVVDLWTYRFLHHVYEVSAEVTGESKFSKAAAATARKWPLYEAIHLQDYGWGIGSHVVDWYHTASQNTTIRGQKLREYNLRMAEVAGEIT